MELGKEDTPLALEELNAKEISHMADVRNLFLGGLALRRLCLFLAAASVALLALLKVPLKHLLPRMLCAGTVLFLGVTALLAGIISTGSSIRGPIF